MFTRFVLAPILVVAVVLGGSAHAFAGVISTQEALSADLRLSAEADAREALAREEVRQAMERLGVDPLDADTRIASLSDAELAQLQGQLDSLPAGGSFFAVVGIVFVVLLILDLVGVTNVFSRV